MKPSLFLFTVLALLPIAALGQPRSSPDANTRPWLVVLNGAQEVTTLNAREVRYRVHQPYPASMAIADIWNTLLLRGWKPSPSVDKQATSDANAFRWSTFEDEQGRFVYRSIYEFRASEGQAVTYMLTYRYERTGSRWRESDLLEVVASLNPSTRKLASLSNRSALLSTDSTNLCALKTVPTNTGRHCSRNEEG